MRPKAKKIVTAKTRWEYYVSNIAGIIALLAVCASMISLSISDSGINFSSIFFWLSIILQLLLPFALISFFSSMKQVEVTEDGLVISYLFQKHKNTIIFSTVAGVEAKAVTADKSIRDSFILKLADGRAFEFRRSQFNNYNTLKSACIKRVQRTNIK